MALKFVPTLDDRASDHTPQQANNELWQPLAPSLASPDWAVWKRCRGIEVWVSLANFRNQHISPFLVCQATLESLSQHTFFKPELIKNKTQENTLNGKGLELCPPEVARTE